MSTTGVDLSPTGAETPVKNHVKTVELQTGQYRAKLNRCIDYQMNVEKSVTVEISTIGNAFATRTVEEIVRLIDFFIRGVEHFYLIIEMRMGN